MTIGARSRIVCEVGVSLGVDKRVGSKADRYAEEDGGQKADCNRTLHPRSKNRKEYASAIEVKGWKN